MASMFHVKHNINDNPSITLEKLMKIKRQLELHNHVIDDTTFSGILFYTIPDTMEIVKQTLAESNNDTTDHIFKAMQRFYEARININLILIIITLTIIVNLLKQLLMVLLLLSFS